MKKKKKLSHFTELKITKLLKIYAKKILPNAKFYCTKILMVNKPF